MCKKFRVHFIIDLCLYNYFFNSCTNFAQNQNKKETFLHGVFFAQMGSILSSEQLMITGSCENGTLNSAGAHCGTI